MEHVLIDSSMSQCGKYVILLMHSVEISKFFPKVFCKNSVKLTFSLKSYTVHQFDEKSLQWGKISEITTLCTSHVKNISSNQLAL